MILKEIYDYFNKDIIYTEKYMDILEAIKYLYIEHEKFDIQEDDISDIYEISGLENAVAYDVLKDGINTVYACLDHYNTQYRIITDKNSNLQNTKSHIYNNNKDTINQMIKDARQILFFYKKLTTSISEFLSNFVNAHNFYEKNISFLIPKIDGGFETIKRTVP